MIIEFYYMKTCPKCKKLLDYLTEIVSLIPDIVVLIPREAGVRDISIIDIQFPGGMFYSKTHLYPEIVIGDSRYVVTAYSKSTFMKIMNIIEKEIYKEISSKKIPEYRRALIIKKLNSIKKKISKDFQ